MTKKGSNPRIQGIVPEEWKEAKVVPIYKKGSKTASGNYRPVSLTCICCKMIESLIKDDIMQHLNRNRLINNSQHGFMKGKSCTTNLLKFLDKVTEAADKGKSIAIDIIYLDFAKAFDKVPTERLLRKVGGPWSILKSWKMPEGLADRQKAASVCEWQVFWMDQSTVRCTPRQRTGAGAVSSIHQRPGQGGCRAPVADEICR